MNREPTSRYTESSLVRVRAAGIGIVTAALIFTAGTAADAGDILRGGAVASPSKRNGSGSQSGAQAAAQTKANAQDRLARTTRAVQAVRAMQVAARGANNLGSDPNHPGFQLPTVPDGLGTGGLDIIGTPTGAGMPQQSGGAGGVKVLIKQSEQQALLNWKTFNIGKNTTLQFDQSAGKSDRGKWIAFNRVTDPSGSPSQILGSIKADGQVYVINQNGIIFGGSSQVNVHALVASSLPINDNLVKNGLLNNPDLQFLFTALPQAAGNKGTPAFTPPAPLTPGGKTGDVTVQSGAQLTAPTTEAKVGGRIALIGANVKNAGTISTPDGQTILAAGLQVAMTAHSPDDPSLRGLDVRVGAVNEYSGLAANTGYIESPRASVIMTGREVRQQGVIDSTTSVSLNGRIDLIASYGAFANPSYDPTSTSSLPYLYSFVGPVTLGRGSVSRILPELWSEEKAVGTELALRSQINMQGRTIHLEGDAAILAPNAAIVAQAGQWTTLQTNAFFNYLGGQIYLDAGALIDAAGTTDVRVPLANRILTVQLRGSELSNSPLQRNSTVRGIDLVIDTRKKGTYHGNDWIGTPLGDATGFLGLIERPIGELTTAGGSVTLTAGGSVVINRGATVDVSGGWVTNEGGKVKTTRLLYRGNLINIEDATPDRLYDGVYTPTFTKTSAKWGVTKTYLHALAPTGEYFDRAAISGAAGGNLNISGLRMSLDGDLVGLTVAGPRQVRKSAALSELPAPSSLSLAFSGILIGDPPIFPPPLLVEFRPNITQTAPQAFALDALGEPLPLSSERSTLAVLSPSLLQESGFGSLSVSNEDGTILVPEDVELTTIPGGAISLAAANIVVKGRVKSPGGTLTFKTYNISPTIVAIVNGSDLPVIPPPDPDRGIFSLHERALLSAAGTFVDDRVTSVTPFTPIAMQGGSITIDTYTAELAEGSEIDVSGGMVMTARATKSFGNGGSLVIHTGKDINLPPVLGGKLALGANLKGFSRLKGGALAIQTTRIQIGGSSADESVFLVQPEFFNQGGFTSFTLNGIGENTQTVGEYLPGLVIAPGTIIEPKAQSLLEVPFQARGRGLGMRTVLFPAESRSPVSLSFGAVGARFAGATLVRGDVIMGEGSVIRTEPLGNVSLTGDTVAVLGSIYAPGGGITIRGAGSYASLPADSFQARATVYISSRTVLSAAGTTLRSFDPYGRRTGRVLPGGSISISGNIVAASGAVLDVSGATDVLDLSPLAADLDGAIFVPRNSGLNSPLASLRTVPTRVDSDGGSITLAGGQMLFSDATLRGFAGGPGAQGGSLTISSGRFYAPNVISSPLDTTLLVTQTGPTIPQPLPDSAEAIGQAMPGVLISRGYFAANSFVNGGFDSLNLRGVVEFSGDVAITARRAIKVADGAFLYANSEVRLTAPYVALGRAFIAPVTDEFLQPPFGSQNQPLYFPPTFGPGRLIVQANLIDVGTLSLQNIGYAALLADNGDIRGNGIFNIAGDLVLRAGQIYPTTASRFTIVAYDHGGQRGSITVQASGQRPLPLSAGGELNVHASVIHQNGVLRAPFGAINIGWDGSGVAPRDLFTGNALPFPVTQELTLGAGSITSVSGIDPLTGYGVLIPYGTSSTGENWLDPYGVDISAGGIPEKSITISALSLTAGKDSVIDIRGGGDLYAYRWVAGLGGTKDILASSSSFAVIPGYDAGFAPYSPFSGTDPGYVNSTLSPGDRVRLGASNGLPAGIYTLLPARYALLPGAFLVTPQSGNALGTIVLPDGSSLVSGYRFNDQAGSRQVSALATRFEVAPADVVRQRARYDDFYASEFLRNSAIAQEAAVPRLPVDAGHLILQATQSLVLRGSVFAQGAPGGRAGLVDISSSSDIFIGYSGNSGPPGALFLDSSLLSGFGAESLLIGGVRRTDTSGTHVTVRTRSLTVDNAGSPLSAPDLILVANEELTLAPGAEVEASGSSPSGADTLLLGDALAPGSGDGLLIRVTGDPLAQIVRAGVSPSTVPRMNIGANSRVAGRSVTLDSTYGTDLDPSVEIDGEYVFLNSGQISLVLNNPGALQATDGLVLSGLALQGLQSSLSLSLLSYSSIDIYGTGQFGTAGSLAFRAAEIRGFNTGGGLVSFSAPDIILDNSVAGTVPGPLYAPDGTLEFNAERIRIGPNKPNVVDQYARLNLNASAGIFLEGNSGLRTQGHLTAVTPFLSAASQAIQTLSAGGDLLIESPANSVAPPPGGLGASITLQGLNVRLNSDIVQPSGVLTLHATGGDVFVAGSVNVAGIARTFYDVTRYTDGGRIIVRSDTGSVNLGPDSVLDVSAQPVAGNAGSILVETPVGAFVSAGQMRGAGGGGGRNGSFSLDAASLADFTSLNAGLNDAFFTESRSFRLRQGGIVVDGLIKSHAFNLSVDQGSITVAGTIDASGDTGGTIGLQANGSVTLLGGSILTVKGQDFSASGKGGEVSLEAGSQRNGVIGAGSVDIQAGSLIDLSVTSRVVLNADPVLDAATPGSSAWFGQFSGKLHLRAPQNGAHTDLLVNPINGTIVDASSIVIEGYRLYDLTNFGGTITTTVQNAILADGQAFMGAAGTTTAGYTTMVNRLLANNAGLGSVAVIAPGAEVINRAAPASLTYSLNTVGSLITIPAAGGTVYFPAGTPGTTTIRTTTSGIITSASGVVTTLAANTNTTLAAGSSVTLNTGGNLSYFSGAGGPITVGLAPGSSYTTGATGVVGTVASQGSTVTLNAANTSSITLAAGTIITLPAGTPGASRIRSTVAGTVTSPTGVVTALAANTNTLVAAGSTVALNAAGTITAPVVSGGAVQVALASGSFTSSGPVAATPATGDLTLGSTASTTTSDWNLATFRFGPRSAPGVLTLRAAGNIVLFNALSDGFATAAYNANLLAQNPLLPVNSQSWSYRLTSGADVSAADYGSVLALSSLGSNFGSLKLGKDNGQNLSNSNGSNNAPGSNALTSLALTNRYQVIRTGSGDIDINSGLSIQLLNQFATIYTAGTRVASYTLNGAFDLPILTQTGGNITLGAIQQTPPYAVQYTMAGGNVSLNAGLNIEHLTTAGGGLVPDSQREMPTNWLYRRGYVDPVTGEFGAGRFGDIASTTWWVDFSNYFQGIGALGGGDVTLIAGQNISNVDAVVPTNARMTKGTPDADNLLELGGGDLIVRSGRDIDAGVYYVERGSGTLEAGRDITTNSTRSLNSTFASDANTWLPTTLFVGKGGFDVSARRNVLLGPVANPFLLPQGINNAFWNKTYFSTYSADSYARVSSLGGDVSLRNAVNLNGNIDPLLRSWYKNRLLFTFGTVNSSGQPWLRLAETSVDDFVTTSALLPPTLLVTAFSESINLLGNVTLFPAARGTLELLAGKAINGLQSTASQILVSDADPSAIPGIASPFAYRAFLGAAELSNTAAHRQTQASFLDFINILFSETGSTEGGLEEELAAHAPGLLHTGDPDPVRLYAGAGNISGLSLFSPKFAQVFAERDITDISFYIQNVDANDISIVASGRDIIPYSANSPLRVLAETLSYLPIGSTPLAGDIQIAGPGTLEILAGRNLDLGTGGTLDDGTGVGITSVGNSRNPYLSFAGASLVIGAGVDLTGGLAGGLNYEEVLSEFGGQYLAEALEGTGGNSITGLSPEAQARTALKVLFLVLRDAGRNSATQGTPAYATGYSAIAKLFGDAPSGGDILTRSRDIRTKNGGDIDIFAPAGNLTLANTTVADTLIPPGIVTESGGSISILTDGSVDIGIGRIFTLRGGNQIIWSSTGDIAAGASSKTVKSAPPTRVLIDGQSADVQTDLAGLATGGGIGVLATVAGVEPGNVDLIAPVGTVDAGDAGIRVTGNLNVAANRVLNADNISAAGAVSGVPTAPVVAAPNIAGLTAASNTAGASTSAANELANQARETPEEEEAPSIITVEVLGYGGGDGA